MKLHYLDPTVLLEGVCVSMYSITLRESQQAPTARVPLVRIVESNGRIASRPGSKGRSSQEHFDGQHCDRMAKAYSIPFSPRRCLRARTRSEEA